MPQEAIQDSGDSLNGIIIGQLEKIVAARVEQVSAANAANVVVVDLLNLHTLLDILMTASAGTATLTVEASADNVNWLTIDSIAAALTTAKHYDRSVVGATTALCPLGFRYIRITAGAAGAGNTTTLKAGAK